MNVKKPRQLVKDCQIPARKVKQVRKRANQRKFFLKWKHLCNFNSPLQALLRPLKVKNTKALFQVDS